MNEHNPDIEAVRNRVSECIDRIGDGATYNGVTVVFHEPEWVNARAVIKATCNDCGATSVMQTDGYPVELQYLAHVVRSYRCPEQGHER